jgi:serine protease Do
MKRYLLSCTVVAMAVLLNQPLQAQEKEQDKEKGKLNNNEEIIIKRKGDKDTKVVIELKGDQVIINGKPLEEYDDEELAILKRKPAPLRIVGSPFRMSAPLATVDGHPPGWSINEESISAFLGVVTAKTNKGVKVEEVSKNSGAEKAGLQKGDIITKIDDVEIDDPDDLTKTIRKHKPEAKVTITYERDGKSDKVTATLGKKKSITTKTFNYDNFGRQFDMLPDFKMGFEGHPLFYDAKPRLGIKAQETEDGKGVKVLTVESESPAEKAGIKQDDVITEFDGKKTNSADELAAAARESRDKSSVKVTFNRNGKSQTAEIKTPKKLKTADL